MHTITMVRIVCSIARRDPVMPIAIETDTLPQTTARWNRACALADIAPWCGVAVSFGQRQIAVFRWGETGRVYALTNLDPFTTAMTISHGIVGDRQGEPTVASSVRQRRFRLRDGRCVDDPTMYLASYPARVINGEVEVFLSV